jgi:hypothetical protein
VGPFVSRGGYDWHSAFGDNLANFDRHTKDGSVFVNAYHIAPVLEDGTTLGLPPLHPHHMHFYPGPTPSHNVLGELHGDMVCEGMEDGTACYLKSLPAGHGFPVEGKLGYDFEVCLEQSL